MGLKKIERIALPSREVFYRDYVLPRRPVIITGLFQGQAIDAIRTAEAARAAFQNVPLEVQMEYSTRAASAESAGVDVMKFSEYLDLVASKPDTRLMCTEYTTPARVSAQYRLPDLCRATPAELARPELLDLPKRWGDHDLLSNVFLANRGNYAHTHYDGDHRQVLLYQVFGKKRVILFQPPSGRKLDVLDAFMQGFSNVYLENMNDREKEEFIEMASGYDAVIEPGEAVYMPMLIWHYLEYLDTGMSVNFRFGRNQYGRFLCVDNFHRDYFIQNVSAKMVDVAKVELDYRDAITEIQAAFVRPYASRAAKLRDIRALFRRVCAEIAPEAEPEMHCPPEREAQQLAQIELELEQTMRYMDVPTNGAAMGVVEGPITASQGRAIRDRLKDMAYPAGVCEKLIYNRFGKPNLDAISRTEASLLMRTFASPGAAW